MLQLRSDPPREDLRVLGRTLREVDRKEVFAAVGEEGVHALIDSFENSTDAWLAYWDEVPVAAFGVSALTETIGGPWMLASYNVEEVPVPLFMRISRKVVELWLQDYALLTNYVDERNAVSKRWLKRLGFVMRETTPFGHLQLPFTRFEKSRCA